MPPPPTAKAVPKGKTKQKKGGVAPCLEAERGEGSDLRDFRATGPPCFGNHTPAANYRGSPSGANRRSRQNHRPRQRPLPTAVPAQWCSSSPQGSETQRDSGREPGVLDSVLNEDAWDYHVKLVNGDAVEQLAEELLHHRRFDHGSLDLLLSMMVASRPQPHRGLWKDVKQSSFVMGFGYYVRGPQSGITKATRQYPKTCQCVNACVAQWFPSLDPTWTSVSVTCNIKSSMHMDVRNLSTSDNYTCAYGPFKDGALWLELREGDPDPGLPLVWRAKPNGARVPGVKVDTRHKPTQISPKRYHCSLPWTGDRYVVTAFTPRGGDAIPKEESKVLRQHGFAPPQSAGLVGMVGELPDIVPGEDAAQTENALSVEDCECILHPLKEAVDALEEIQTVYPPVARLDVAMLCDPWMSVESCGDDLSHGGVSYMVLGFKNKCDFSTHKGFRMAQEQLLQLRPRWVVCNVPRSPTSVRVASDMGEKESARIKKYQRVVRHLRLLSRQALENHQEVVWLSHPESKVWKLPEVLAFWKANAHGPLMLGNEKVRVTSASAAIQNTFSTTTFAGFFQVSDSLGQDQAASQNSAHLLCYLEGFFRKYMDVAVSGDSA